MQRLPNELPTVHGINVIFPKALDVCLCLQSDMVIRIMIFMVLFWIICVLTNSLLQAYVKQIYCTFGLRGELVFPGRIASLCGDFVQGVSGI